MHVYSPIQDHMPAANPRPQQAETQLKHLQKVPQKFCLQLLPPSQPEGVEMSGTCAATHCK